MPAGWDEGTKRFPTTELLSAGMENSDDVDMTPLIHTTNRSHAATPENRRRSQRFPITEEIRFRLLDRRQREENGTGTTLNMSRSGVLFTTDRELEAGKLLVVSVNWPVALNGTCPLQLVGMGHVVRSGAGKAAVEIQRYQFKTRGRLGVARRQSMLPAI